MNIVASLKKLALEYAVGDKGLDGLSWQEPFPEETDCIHCGGKARPMFTLKDDDLCELHPNEGLGPHEGFEGCWPHDSTAVAVYLCKECCEPTALWNQA